jgi:hypothetical protein
LGLGLNFIPLPDSVPSHRIHSSIVSSLSALKRRIALRLHFGTSPYNSVIPPPPSNFYPELFAAKDVLDTVFDNIYKNVDLHCSTLTSKRCWKHDLIRVTLKELYALPSIIIKPADKNVGITVMNVADYIDMCMTHLNDSITYDPITSYDCTPIFAQLKSILIHHDEFIDCFGSPTPISTSLLQSEFSSRPAAFYCLPKLHKNTTPVQGRPIASCIGTPTQHASIFLHNSLQPLLKYIPTHCQSSRSVISAVNTLPPLPSDSVLFCADVTSLYPSIPIDFGLNAVRWFFGHIGWDEKNQRFLLDLLHWILTNNYVCFNGKIYRQKKGTAMGTPVAVTYSDIVLYSIEYDIVNSLLYWRFIDDLFWVTTQLQAFDFLVKFNNKCPSIQLEQVTVAKTGIFLDLELTLVEKNEGLILTHTLYQKPISMFQYIPPSSQHPRRILSSFILSELKRYKLSCCSREAFSIIAEQFTQRLLARGYDTNIIAEQLTRCPSRDDLLEALQKKEKTTPPARPILVLDLPILSTKVPWQQILEPMELLEKHQEFIKIYQVQQPIIASKLPKKAGAYLTRSNFGPQ